MLALKQLLLMGTVAGVGGVPIAVHTLKQHVKSREEQKQIDGLVNKWVLPASSESDVKHQRVFNLFSKNIPEFNSLFLESFIKKFIYQWSNKYHSSEDLLSKSATIKQKLHSLSNDNFYNQSDKHFYVNRNREAWNLNQVFDAGKDFFINAVFDSIFLKFDADSLAIDDNKANNPLRKMIADFQKSAINQWITDEKPFYLVEDAWNYSGGKPTLYADDVTTSLTSSGFTFPDFTALSGYSTLITNIKAKTNTDKTSEKLFTDTDLLASDDGWYINGLLRKYTYLDAKSRNSSTSPAKTDSTNELDVSSGTLTDKYGENPTHLFLEKYTEGMDCVKFEKDLIKDSANKNKLTAGSSNACAFTFRNIKNATNTNSPYSFFRHKKGVSAVYRSVSTDSFKQKLINTLVADASKTKDAKSETSKKFLKYLEKNLAVVVADYMTDTSINSKFIDLSESEAYIDLLKESYELAKLSQQTSNYWSLKTKMFDAASEFVSVESKAENSKQLIKKEFGLTGSISLDTSIDHTTDIEEINLSETGKQSSWSKNDGNIKEIRDSLDYEKISLKVDSIREKLKNYLNTFEQFTNNASSNISFNNYVPDFIFNSFIKDEEKMDRYVRNQHTLDQLKIDWKLSDLSKYWSTTLALIKTSLGDASFTSEKLQGLSTEAFQLRKYLGESLGSQLSYGGFKNSDSQLEQLKIKSKNYWTIKNYCSTLDGYSLSSDSITEYITHLYSLPWLLDGEIGRVMKHLIPDGDYGALVWVQDVGSTEYSTLNGKETSKIYAQENLETTFFKESIANLSIFNPIFNTKQFNAGTIAHTVKTTALPQSAVAYLDGRTSKTLHGFRGLQTKSNFSKELPAYIKNAIFDKFSSSNPINNKNYQDPSTSHHVTSNDSIRVIGHSFGMATEFDKTDADTVFAYYDNFTNKELLLKALKDKNPLLNASVRRDIMVYHNDINISLLSLVQLKTIIKKVIEDDEGHKESFKRFSGLLQHPLQTVSYPAADKKYLLNDDTTSQTGKLVFVLQVNTADFTQNLSSLKDKIDSATIVKSLYLLSNNKGLLKNIFATPSHL